MLPFVIMHCLASLWGQRLLKCKRKYPGARSYKRGAGCAGARDDVRTCYLKDSMQRDPDIMAYAYSYAPPYLHRDYPQVTNLILRLHLSHRK